MSPNTKIHMQKTSNRTQCRVERMPNDSLQAALVQTVWQRVLAIGTLKSKYDCAQYIY